MALDFDGAHRLSASFEEAAFDDYVFAQASPIKMSFTSPLSIIRGGNAQLNQISCHLSDLPDTARAKLLIAPHDLAHIDGRGADTWNGSVNRIRKIRDYYGLSGMEIDDRPKAALDVSYEEDLARQLRAAWKLARGGGQSITTGWFMPTLALLNGQQSVGGPVVVENNLYALRNSIARKGDALITRAVSVKLFPDEEFHLYWAATDWKSSTTPGKVACSANFTKSGEVHGDSKEGSRFLTARLSARPFALMIHPR